MIEGSILVGGEDRRSTATFRAVAAASGKPIGPVVNEAGPRDVLDACEKAAAASAPFGILEPARRATFLDAIGEEILAIGPALIETAMAETGLPQARLENERGRTINQLAMFAEELRGGYWLDVVIDTALPDRVPPRPDLRRMNVPIGPVAVFGASNFPLAFSVAGGDTASALAAGCPVVVKGHPAHPGTGELVARAIRAAVVRTGMPEGVFSFLPGIGTVLGGDLVANEHIKAVGFTGSRAGGLALVQVAQSRKGPIPVYAEMSSINPVVLLPHALATRTGELGRQFAASLTLGAGQFCTNPGVVFGIAGPDLDAFSDAAAEALGNAQVATMLTSYIRGAFEAAVSAIEARPHVRRVGGITSAGLNNAALFVTDIDRFVSDSHLSAEVFGASAIVVACKSPAEISRALSALEGQLTVTLQCDEEDADLRQPSFPSRLRRPDGLSPTAGRPGSRWRRRWFMAGHSLRHQTGARLPSGRSQCSDFCGLFASRTSRRPCCPRRYAMKIFGASNSAGATSGDLKRSGCLLRQICSPNWPRVRNWRSWHVVRFEADH